MNTIGNNIKITFFGESHGPHIGVTIDNLPAGLEIDRSLLEFNLTKRRPAKGISTTRVETDSYQFISGYNDGKTTGGALTILIDNNNTISNDYKNLNFTPRPSHADYPAYMKYHGKNDVRGGGFFSGRLTALWVVVGSIAEQILLRNNIIVGSHILRIKNIMDEPFNPNQEDFEQLIQLNKDSFPLINSDQKKSMVDLISASKMDLNSVGGVVESKIINMPVGVGEPYFLSVESYVSSLLFSIPALKGVEFGSGFAISELFGSEANDQYEIKDNAITTLSNHNGGILGGLTSGRPIIIRTAFKPTSSIARKQQSVDLEKMENTSLVIKGRHDPQIVSRAVHVVNAVLNFACLDLLMFHHKEVVF